MGSGPSNAEPRVLQAMAAAPITPDDPAFGSLLHEIATLIGSVFQAANARSLAVPARAVSRSRAVRLMSFWSSESVNRM